MLHLATALDYISVIISALYLVCAVAKFVPEVCVSVTLAYAGQKSATDQHTFAELFDKEASEIKYKNILSFLGYIVIFVLLGILIWLRPCSRPISELLDDSHDAVITECGLNAAVKLLVDALTVTRDHEDGGRHLDQLIELFRAVQLLLELLLTTSPPSDCACPRDVIGDVTGAEFDVRVTSWSDCDAIDDATTLSLRRLQNGGRDVTDSNFRSRHVDDDDNDNFERQWPALSVRLSSWCLCDQLRTVPLTHLLAGIFKLRLRPVGELTMM